MTEAGTSVLPREQTGAVKVHPEAPTEGLGDATEAFSDYVQHDNIEEANQHANSQPAANTESAATAAAAAPENEAAKAETPAGNESTVKLNFRNRALLAARRLLSGDTKLSRRLQKKAASLNAEADQSTSKIERMRARLAAVVPTLGAMATSGQALNLLPVLRPVIGELDVADGLAGDVLDNLDVDADGSEPVVDLDSSDIKLTSATVDEPGAGPDIETVSPASDGLDPSINAEPSADSSITITLENEGDTIEGQLREALMARGWSEEDTHSPEFFEMVYDKSGVNEGNSVMEKIGVGVEAHGDPGPLDTEQNVGASYTIPSDQIDATYDKLHPDEAAQSDRWKHEHMLADDSATAGDDTGVGPSGETHDGTPTDDIDRIEGAGRSGDDAREGAQPRTDSSTPGSTAPPTVPEPPATEPDMPTTTEGADSTTAPTTDSTEPTEPTTTTQPQDSTTSSIETDVTTDESNGSESTTTTVNPTPETTVPPVDEENPSSSVAHNIAGIATGTFIAGAVGVSIHDSRAVRRGEPESALTHKAYSAAVKNRQERRRVEQHLGHAIHRGEVKNLSILPYRGYDETGRRLAATYENKDDERVTVYSHKDGSIVSKPVKQSPTQDDSEATDNPTAESPDEGNTDDTAGSEGAKDDLDDIAFGEGAGVADDVSTNLPEDFDELYAQLAQSDPTLPPTPDRYFAPVGEYTSPEVPQTIDTQGQKGQLVGYVRDITDRSQNLKKWYPVYLMDAPNPDNKYLLKSNNNVLIEHIIKR